MAKIGVFGGSFNPIHKGHILLMEGLKSKLNLDKVLLLPYRKTPHKNVNLAPAIDRFNLCCLAVKNIKYADVLKLALTSNASGYTIDILKKIKEKFPLNEIFLIIGPDMFLTFNQWFKYREILKLAKLVSATDSEDEIKTMKALSKSQNYDAIIEKINLLKISSTLIRFKLAQKLDCSSYLDANVANYIYEKKIYCKNNALVLECINVTRNNLSKTRFIHCILVAKAAKKLAKQYGENEKDAFIAGILHDILKEKEEKFYFEFSKKYNINIPASNKASSKLWHSIFGAIFCEKVLGIENENIVNAIKYHTTARKGMTVFEKIIYIADCISDDRDYKEAHEERKIVNLNLDNAILLHLKTIIKVLTEKENYIHPATIACYNELILKN